MLDMAYNTLTLALVIMSTTASVFSTLLTSKRVDKHLNTEVLKDYGTTTLMLMATMAALAVGMALFILYCVVPALATSFDFLNHNARWLLELPLRIMAAAQRYNNPDAPSNLGDLYVLEALGPKP